MSSPEAAAGDSPGDPLSPAHPSGALGTAPTISVVTTHHGWLSGQELGQGLTDLRPQPLTQSTG